MQSRAAYFLAWSALLCLGWSLSVTVCETWRYQKNAFFNGQSCRLEDQLMNQTNVRTVIECAFLSERMTGARSLFYHSQAKECRVCKVKYASSELSTLEDWPGSLYFADSSTTYQNVFGDSGYMLTPGAQNWTDGVALCHVQGGFPISIETEAEDNFTRAFLQSSNAGRTWIGLNQPLGAGTGWVWEGTGQTLSFSGFLPGEPNYAPEQCVMMHPSYQFGWADTLCSLNYRMLCEFPR